MITISSIYSQTNTTTSTYSVSNTIYKNSKLHQSKAQLQKAESSYIWEKGNSKEKYQSRFKKM